LNLGLVGTMNIEEFDLNWIRSEGQKLLKTPRPAFAERRHTAAGHLDKPSPWRPPVPLSLLNQVGNPPEYRLQATVADRHKGKTA
jgi:hypothetical protein